MFVKIICKGKNRSGIILKLIELQKLFRYGKIKEKDIPKQQLEKLKELYHKQINFLENSIEADRQKILKIKNQL